ncbi:hypothetical protein [Leifsonia sp. Leaf264]|uniref:hypothetical protein n=1 Tax=Leifsonia sp. Leaf264 TaxID=1736314 RepID=UPI0006FA29A9|nr:hypothetical protein [Leifsonia sp. Leaf264]KQO98813.1 hypothetical protein ASF30_12180 [Leifsonia sp. Leaf264]
MDDIHRLLAMRDKYADLHPDFVWDEEISAWFVKDLDDRTRVWVSPLMFTFAVIVGEPDEPFYDDRWCFETSDVALAAAVAWQGPYPGSEPVGWHRHPTSGRRRAEGDPASEYVAH